MSILIVLSWHTKNLQFFSIIIITMKVLKRRILFIVNHICNILEICLLMLPFFIDNISP